MPGRNRRELQEGAAAVRVAVIEVAGRLVECDLEELLLHPVVEPRAPEDELAKPVDERLLIHDRETLPVAHEVVAEQAAGLADPALRRELDEVVGLLGVEVARLDEPELHRGGGHALLEVDRAEPEPVAEELDHVLVAARVVRVGHRLRIAP